MSPGSLLERSNVMTLAFIIYAIAGGVAAVLGDLPFTDYRDGLIAGVDSFYRFRKNPYRYYRYQEAWREGFDAGRRIIDHTEYDI